jgi:hypothetical protein
LRNRRGGTHGLRVIRFGQGGSPSWDKQRQSLLPPPKDPLVSQSGHLAAAAAIDDHTNASNAREVEWFLEGRGDGSVYLYENRLRSNELRAQIRYQYSIKRSLRRPLYG